jgi:hypothetical protein
MLHGVPGNILHTVDGESAGGTLREAGFGKNAAEHHWWPSRVIWNKGASLSR